MNTITRNQLLECLDHQWKGYAERFHTLSADEQSIFLTRQGYTRLADLLAHVRAWWQAAIPAVKAMLNDPTLQNEDVDVDRFNAQAVKSVSAWSETEVVMDFERTRQLLSVLVQTLPVSAFKDDRIVWRLNIEICGHYDEHHLN